MTEDIVDVIQLLVSLTSGMYMYVYIYIYVYYI